MHALNRLAYGEYKVTRLLSTGSAAFLDAEDPPPGFVRIELGYGMDQRPCCDCHKPCTLDYTLNNLRELNQRNVVEADMVDPGMIGDKVRKAVGIDAPLPPLALVKQPSEKQRSKRRQKHHRRSVAQDQRLIRQTLRRAGVRVVAGQYVDDRPRTWLPSNPNRFGRGGMARMKVRDEQGNVVKDAKGEPVTKLVDQRAAKLVKAHKKRQAAKDQEPVAGAA